MKLSNPLKLGFLVTVMATPVWQSQIVFAGEEQRAPPQARTAGTLGPQVMRAISNIQELMTPEDPEDEPNLVEAKAELDELYERRFERMNDFEKQTTLNFFTNYYLTLENYPEAINTFEQLLTIETLREDTKLRTLKSLGQLYMAEEEYSESVRNYVLWREASLEEDDIVFRGLSYGHYQQEQFAEALPYWISYMQLLLSREVPLDRDDYAYLNGIYFTLEDFVSALDVTKSMIMLYDEATDWMNLSAVYASIDDEERRVRSLNLAYLKGYVEDDNRFLNLGQSMAGLDIPMSGTKIIKEGLDAGIMEADEDNLTIYTQMFLLASEYEAALEPALAVADFDESGDGWDNVGYIHYVTRNYEDAVEAFQNALDKGDLSDRGDTLLFLARSKIELEDFEGALEAATEAADFGDREENTAAVNYITFINSTQSRFNIIAERKAIAIDFYQPYPSLQ